MVEKITINPKKVRGLGNIVSEKTRNNFLPVNCRSRDGQTGTINGIERDVFFVDMGVNGLTPTYLEVSGPTMVDFSTENIIFTVSLLNSNTDERIVEVNNGGSHASILCIFNEETYSATVNNEGIATFSISNEFDGGVYTLEFLFNTVAEYTHSYKNWRLIIGDLSDNTLEVLPLKNTIQNTVITPVLARFRSGGFGVKNQILYFFERYVTNTLRLGLLKDIIENGGSTEVFANYRDEDGSSIVGQTIYFFEKYLPLILRSSFEETIQLGKSSNVVASYRDEDGSGIQGDTIYFFERYEGPRIVAYPNQKGGVAGEDDIIFKGNVNFGGNNGVYNMQCYFVWIQPNGYEIDLTGAYSLVPNSRGNFEMDYSNSDDARGRMSIVARALYSNVDAPMQSSSFLFTDCIYYFKNSFNLYKSNSVNVTSNTDSITFTSQNTDGVVFFAEDDTTYFENYCFEFTVLDCSDWDAVLVCMDDFHYDERHSIPELIEREILSGDTIRIENVYEGQIVVYVNDEETQYNWSGGSRFGFEIPEGEHITLTDIMVYPWNDTISTIDLSIRDSQITQTGETCTLELSAYGQFDDLMKNVTLKLYKSNGSYVIVNTGNTGIGTYNYTGIGAGEVEFVAKAGLIESEPLEIYDYLFYDDCTSNKISSYTMLRCSLALDNNKLVATRSSSGYCYVELEPKGNSLNAYLGKTIQFDCDIFEASSNVRISIYQQVNDEWIGSSSNYRSGNSSQVIIADIDPSATRVRVRLDLRTLGANGTCKFKNFSVHPTWD